jgi:hypothetical protein
MEGLFVVVLFNGMGSVRPQGLRYANSVETLRDGKTLYSAFEPGDKLFTHVWPAEDFDDVWVRATGDAERIRGEPQWGTTHSSGFIFHRIWHRWFPPCSETQVAKGLHDVRDALALQTLPLVLYGTSRGAALVFLVAARLAPEERARIRLAVAEAPYDALGNVVYDRYGWSLPQTWLNSWFNAPLDTDFPHDIPLIMISGTDDTECPLAGQMRLAEKLETHPEFTHIVVQGAHHNNLWQYTVVKEMIRAKLMH